MPDALTHHSGGISKEWVVAIGTKHIGVFVEDFREKLFVTFEDGETSVVSSNWTPGRRHAKFFVNDVEMGVKLDPKASFWRLRWRGIDLTVTVRIPRVDELARKLPAKRSADTSKMLLCPMPGLMTAIHVREGDAVEQGQGLATVEAMKMENVLRAERRAVVKRIATKVGDILAVDELIMEFS